MCRGGRLITRSQIVEALKKWQSGELSAREVYDWAQQQYWPGRSEFEDEDVNGSSASSEVLAMLDQLPANLIVREDVPTFLKFLEASADQFDVAFKCFSDTLANIDSVGRRKTLSSDEFY
jgi:hypothetical protein